MKGFKFLNGFEEIQRRSNNGVTDQYLIELSMDLLTYSDWIYTWMLTIDDETGFDSLVFEFDDIDQQSYMCTIYQNLTFRLYLIGDSITGREYIETIFLSEDVHLNHHRILEYLINMPKTISSFL